MAMKDLIFSEGRPLLENKTFQKSVITPLLEWPYIVLLLLS